MRITSNTLLPVSSIIVISSVILWVSLTYARVEENTKDIEDAKRDHKEVMLKLEYMASKLSRIEGYLERESFRKAK